MFVITLRLRVLYVGQRVEQMLQFIMMLCIMVVNPLTTMLKKQRVYAVLN
jgi:hypothetical protein